MSFNGTLRGLAAAFIRVVRNGPVQSIRLLWICLALPVLMRGWPIWTRFRSRVHSAVEKQFLLDREISRWRVRKDELLQTGANGYRVRLEDVAAFSRAGSVHGDASGLASEVVTLAEIDQDGFLLSHLGPLEGVPSVDKQEFQPRIRFRLSVIAVDGYIGVRKDYLGNKWAFIRELVALHELGVAGCNVPAIMDVDFDALVLTMSYIPGPVLREKLAENGAILRDRDVEADSEFSGLSASESRLKRIQEGREILSQVVDDSFVNRLLDEIRKAHAAGFVIPGTIKYGNVIIESLSGNPYLIDFENTRYCRSATGRWFSELRDRDIESFNLHFGKAELTRQRIRRKIQQQNTIYAPVYFGGGVRSGKIWYVESGYGRWHYILKKSLPDPRGKRILDLGANNAAVSIELLRSGAEEVVGVEMDAQYREQGEFVKAGFEQMDNNQYAFAYLPVNMKEVPGMDLGKFDMVLALCSIYYLEDDEIVNLVNHVATISDVMVLQCNVARAIGRDNSETYRRATVEYAVNTLRENGFTKINVVAPYRYSRPLVVGRKSG